MVGGKQWTGELIFVLLNVPGPESTEVGGKRWTGELTLKLPGLESTEVGGYSGVAN